QKGTARTLRIRTHMERRSDYDYRRSIGLWLAVLTIVHLAGCTTSTPVAQKAYEPHLMPLHPPNEGQAVTSYPAHIDTVRIIEKDHQKALLVSGKLPNGCAKLGKAKIIASDTLTLQLWAWQPEELMCTQALVPFSFIFDGLPQKQLEGQVQVQINNQHFKIQRL